VDGLLRLCTKQRMKNTTRALLALLGFGCLQACSKKDPETIVQTVHDTVTIRPVWTDTFIGRYSDDKGITVDDQIALLQYLREDSIVFDMKVSLTGERHRFNIKKLFAPVEHFTYIAPDSIDAGGQWFGGNGGGFYRFSGVRK
jgi:hypothetical protein